MGTLSALFQDRSGAAAWPVSLEESLTARILAGRTAWPAVRLDDATYVVYLADRVHRGELPLLVHAADLWIACACVEGGDDAAAALTRVYRPVIEQAAARVARWDADDAAQHVLASLLVRTSSAPPRIAEYAGRASLKSWLRTVATRAALNRRRRKDAQPHESVSALADAAIGCDVDLQLLRTRCAPLLDEAMRMAIGQLDSRDRVVLRMHEVDRWPIDRIGACYGVGRSTAARWVNRARHALLTAAKQLLRDQLNVSEPELESLLRVMQSDILGVSLVRLLTQVESG